MVNAEFVGREGLSGFAPGGIIFVVDNMVGAEGFEDLGFAGGRGCGDYAGAGGFGKLQLSSSILSRVSQALGSHT